MTIFIILSCAWLALSIGIILYEVHQHKSFVKRMAMTHSMAQINERIKDCDNILKEENLYHDKIFIDAILSNKTLWGRNQEKKRGTVMTIEQFKELIYDICPNGNDCNFPCEHCQRF